MADVRKQTDDDPEPKADDKGLVEGDADETEGEPLPKDKSALAKVGDEADKSALDAPAAGPDDEPSEGDDDAVLPAQIGYRRYIYATFFAFGICISYFLSKAGVALWHRLSQWTPKVGEPREDLVTPVAAVLGALIIWLVYRRQDVRTLSDEVALELSKVEWPTKESVRRSTTIVIGATLGASLAFWLYDIGANHAITFIAQTSETWKVLLKVIGGGVAIWLIRAIGLRFVAGVGRA